MRACAHAFIWVAFVNDVCSTRLHLDVCENVSHDQ